MCVCVVGRGGGGVCGKKGNKTTVKNKPGEGENNTYKRKKKVIHT